MAEVLERSGRDRSGRGWLGPRRAASHLRVLALPFEALAGARGHVLPLAVLMMGCGIGLWFAWGAEPGRLALSLWGLCGAGMLAGALAGPHLLRPTCCLGAALALGFLVAALRVQIVAAPMLEFRYYGPIEGRVVEIDRSGSDALRLTLDRVVLRDMAPARTPARVRVALHGDLAFMAPQAGQTVMVTGHLAPPEAAVEPGGFDFRRMAFFRQLGAVGYSRDPVMLLAPPGGGEAWIGRLRAHLSAGIKARIPGEAGAFASGALTGDRSGISQATVEALRDSSLAHILAISGMNLAFLCSFVFAFLRGAIACVPVLALRVNAKKIAAVASFFVALFYLQLSGSNVATERAFLMVSVIMFAVLIDRRSISIRSAAISGAILMLWRPEILLEPGFQMSFAATVALIAGFEAMDRGALHGRLPRWMAPVVTLVASSVIGGFASAPYAAAHFNRFADYGLIANLLTVPAMGLLIMPGGALAFLLAPFGLEAPALWLVGLGARWILHVAYAVADMEGSVTGIPAPGAWVLALVTLAMAWLVLWPGRARLLGIPGVLACLALWPMGGRPDLLVSADGRLVGLMGPQGRALSSARGGGFSASNWLENDGDLVEQAVAAARPGFTGPPEARGFSLAGIEAVALSGKKGRALLDEACAGADLVILNLPMAAAERPPGCRLLDERLLRETGTLAFRLRPDGTVLVTATRARARAWSGPGADLAALVAMLPEGVVVAGP
ncbi:ComEC/Rec2 family competence protein [Pseudogemmobacter sonorensis]|uniref:ComEC/Rec2 family competence protein n=1 Tax=Pseudogemmobacter sonorensis TaxID=2989681 RepID=UPI0036A7B04B